jgi:hypothetical protein
LGLRTLAIVWIVAAVSLGSGPCRAAGLMPGDLVVTDARIYTARPQRGMAEALAVKDGKIAFVGNAIDAKQWVGPRTRVLRLGGKLVLPGLFDSHIHPLDIVDFDVCNFESKPQKTLSDLSAFVRFMGKRVYVSNVRKTNAKRG